MTNVEYAGNTTTSHESPAAHTDAAEGAHEESGLHISLKPEVIGKFWGEWGHIPITNTLLTSWLVMIVLIVTAFFVMKNLRLIPGKIQMLFELLVGGIYDYIEETLEDKKLARKVFPIITTLFFFILFANWMGLLPGIGSITVKNLGEGGVGASLFYPVSTDLNVTLALAIVAFLTIEICGVATIGFLKYAGKFVNLKAFPGIGFWMGLIDLFSELARLISFSFRLFGNIFAGKVMILVALFFMPLFLPVPLMAFEFLVGFIQAAVFALLTLFFIKVAIMEHGEAH